MREHLSDDFDSLYFLDLGGNVRKNPKLSGTTHNVFGIQVGVIINFLVKRNGKVDSKPDLFYARVDEFWRKEEKYRYLDAKEQYDNIKWERITPDRRHTWITKGQRAEFQTFVPMGKKDVKEGKSEPLDVLFSRYSNGVKTNRDAWAYNFSRHAAVRKHESNDRYL